MFKLGLIINPLAGIGGAVGLKGSDGEAIVAQAFAKGAHPKSAQRMRVALEALLEHKDELEILTYPLDMGADLVADMGFSHQVFGSINAGHTSAQDTEAAVQLLEAQGIDLLLFAGGDGTARNVCDAVSAKQAVLGIPAGVKIHSGVYAVSPKAGGEVVRQLVCAELVGVAEAEVRDIDEEAFRHGKVRARYYGDMLIPREHRYIQAVKQGGREVEELVLADIAAWVVEEMEDDCFYVVAPGTTTRAVMDELGLENSLLGVDLILNKALVGLDLSADELLDKIAHNPAKIILTAIGGQGHVLGRGNHQLSPELVGKIGKENLIIIATRSKLQTLDGRPLQVDSGDVALDAELSGTVRVITGYQDEVFYPLGMPEL